MAHLPPLRLLATFEAVARLGTMRDAAAELNVTQPAVTQALKALEDHVGAQLLDRRTRPAGLTEPGRLLARATRDGLEMIGAAIDEIRTTAEAAEMRLTVSCTLGMATYWLMPRLPDFYARHPDLLVNVQAPPSDLPTISGGVDLALRYGTGGWRDGETIKLFDESVCPVGRPAVIDALLADGVDLDRAPLIHVRSTGAHRWESWADYLRRRGFRRPPGGGQSFDNYVQAVQAAMDGRGLMLGWRSITHGLTSEGALMAWPGGTVDLGTSYYVTLSDTGAESVAARSFMDWLVTLPPYTATAAKAPPA